MDERTVADIAQLNLEVKAKMVAEFHARNDFFTGDILEHSDFLIRPGLTPELVLTPPAGLETAALACRKSIREVSRTVLGAAAIVTFLIP